VAVDVLVGDEDMVGVEVSVGGSLGARVGVKVSVGGSPGKGRLVKDGETVAVSTTTGLVAF
jgi:hypothetical protein